MEPSMKKPEIKEYLSSIYGMDVVNVKTLNVAGDSTSVSLVVAPALSAFGFVIFLLAGKKKRKQLSERKQIWYKEADWKKAIVQYNEGGDHVSLS